MKKILFIGLFIACFNMVVAQVETITGHGELLRLDATHGYALLSFYHGDTKKAHLWCRPDRFEIVSDSGDLRFRARTENMILKTNGNLGIGTLDPEGRLTVESRSNPWYPHIDLIETDPYNYGTVKFRNLNTNDDYWEIQVNSGFDDIFRIVYSPGEYMDETYFNISESLNNTRLRTDLLQMNIHSLYDIGNDATDNWDNIWAMTYNSGSDRRLKENIKDVSSVLSSVMELRPVTYNYIDKKDQDRIGFIAQEVLPLFPQAVSSYDLDIIDGKEVKTDYEYLGMSYMELIPVLTKAIQEQQDQIQENNMAIKNQQAMNEKQQVAFEEQQAQIKALKLKIKSNE